MSGIRSSISQYWDAAAADFDNEADHGLREEATRSAWAELLRAWVPVESGDVLDVGCGTGSLSLLLAEQGHRVTGVDVSSSMIELARAKLEAAGRPGQFFVGDAAKPPTEEKRFDVVLSRHVVWTLPDPVAALQDWINRLRPGGTLILVEGRWFTADADEPYAVGAEELPWNGGVRAADLEAAVRPLVSDLRTVDLTGDPSLWGWQVTDERYALIATV